MTTAWFLERVESVTGDESSGHTSVYSPQGRRERTLNNVTDSISARNGSRGKAVLTQKTGRERLQILTLSTSGLVTLREQLSRE